MKARLFFVAFVFASLSPGFARAEKFKWPVPKEGAEFYFECQDGVHVTRKIEKVETKEGATTLTVSIKSDRPESRLATMHPYQQCSFGFLEVRDLLHKEKSLAKVAGDILKTDEFTLGSAVSSRLETFQSDFLRRDGVYALEFLPKRRFKAPFAGREVDAVEIEESVREIWEPKRSAKFGCVLSLETGLPLSLTFTSFTGVTRRCEGKPTPGLKKNYVPELPEGESPGK